MKTFRLVRLQIIYHTREKINFVDGLVINKEEGKGRWIVEIYTQIKYEEIFLGLPEEFLVYATISHKGHDPVPLFSSIHSITKMGDCISILLDSKMVSEWYHDTTGTVLDTLLQQGLTGADLLTTFKKKMHELKLEKQI